MHAILFVLGIATSAVGFVVIGFGIPDSAFSLGNTLILAGTVAAVGGFILIALSSVVRQLTRIAQGQSMHAPSLPLGPADSYQSRVQTRLNASQGPAAPPMRPEPMPMPRPPAPAPIEPKLAPVPAASASDSDLAWLRPKNATPSFGEQAVIDEMEASLSPAAAPPPTGSQPRLVVSASQGASAGQTGEIAVDVSPQMRGDPDRATPPVEHPNAGGLFDTVWPEIRPAGRSAETVARARKQEGAPPQRDESKTSQAPAAQAPMAQAPAVEEPRPVAILKSGMIDGMAYTLYADGSIEAVLASGPIRFASIDALRMHLEKNA